MDTPPPTIATAERDSGGLATEKRLDWNEHQSRDGRTAFREWVTDIFTALARKSLPTILRASGLNLLMVAYPTRWARFQISRAWGGQIPQINNRFNGMDYSWLAKFM